ncbi:MAG: hypothetical protein JWP85_14 [Rhodoglobus sp.]|nr:hypothetical protein [Rhodoglobus sp.]
MIRHARSALAALALIASAASLSSCSLLGPSRDADGRVTETSEINSTALLVGDCFSFVEGTNLARASLTPCAEVHTYVVIGMGELTTPEIDEAGGLQNAVSASCSEVFTTFKEAAADGFRPEQEFVVSVSEEDGEQITSYHCVATDAVATT